MADTASEVVVWEPVEVSTKPSLPRHLTKSTLDTGLASTAEKRVPSSVIDWCCSYDVAAMTEVSANSKGRHSLHVLGVF